MNIISGIYQPAPELRYVYIAVSTPGYTSGMAIVPDMYRTSIPGAHNKYKTAGVKIEKRYSD